MADGDEEMIIRKKVQIEIENILSKRRDSIAKNKKSCHQRGFVRTNGQHGRSHNIRPINLLDRSYERC